MNNRQKKLRKKVLRTLVFTSAAVLLLIAVGFLLSRYIPVWQQQQVDSALRSGDTDRARSLAEQLDDEDRIAVLQQCSYREAAELEAQGLYAEASALYSEAGSYEDASERRKLCDYKFAEQLEQQGKWDEAVEAFRALGSYGDAADRVSLCRLNEAKALLEAGEGWEAAAILDTLPGLEEAQELLIRSLVEMTGLEEEKALAAFHGMDKEQLAALSQLQELRDALPKGIVDVGFYHTVGLGEDGRVLACGDNSFGQCDTADWSDAVAVSAGAYHTVALLRDGTVVSTGRNTEGQCETAAWSNVIQIAAADYSTFALCADGTVLCTDYLDYSEPESWTNIVSITAGSYGIAAIRNDGSVWFYPEMLHADTITSAQELIINTGYAAALLGDGTAVCTALELPDWSNVLTLSGSGTAILALEAGGFVDAYFFAERDAVDFSSVMNASAIAAGGTHFAVVFSDGTVKVFGDTSRGQGDTDSWLLAVGAPN